MTTEETASGSSSETEQKSEAPSVLPIRFTSVTTKGFGRGSKDLGIPTANLDRTQTRTFPELQFEDLPCGIYWGFCRIASRRADDSAGAFTTHTAAISIGFNPTYGNTVKTVEPHLIAPANHDRRHASSCRETVFDNDFYDEPIRLSVVGYLRPELPFEGLDKLIAAIKQDISNAERMAESVDPVSMSEKAWVDSERSVDE